MYLCVCIYIIHKQFLIFFNYFVKFQNGCCGFFGWTDLRAKGFCLVTFYIASFGVPHRRKTPPLAAL